MRIGPVKFLHLSFALLAVVVFHRAGDAQQPSPLVIQGGMLIDGTGRAPFHYRDKGIMAMIGRKAAVAELGPHRHEMHGRLAFAAWLGVHAELLANTGAELKAFVAWAEDFYVRPHHRSAELLDPSQVELPKIHWRQSGNRAPRST